MPKSCKFPYSFEFCNFYNNFLILASFFILCMFLVNQVVQAFKFAETQLFESESDRVSQIKNVYYKVYLDNIADEINSLHSLAIDEDFDLDNSEFKKDYVIPIVDKICTTKVLIYEAKERFFMFLFFWLKIIFIFSIAALILESLRPESFKGINCIREDFFHSICLFERILYFTIVTFVTVGYGDISPLSMLSTILINIEAVTSFVLTTFGIGIFIALLIEASDLAWESRREIITRDILSTLRNGNPRYR